MRRFLTWGLLLVLLSFLPAAMVSAREYPVTSGAVAVGYYPGASDRYERYEHWRRRHRRHRHHRYYRGRYYDRDYHYDRDYRDYRYYR